MAENFEAGSNIIYLNNFKNNSTPVQANRFTRPVIKDVVLSEEAFHYEAPTPKKQAADPLKNPVDINRVSYLLTSTGRYRDNLLFIMGCNFGLRIGDLLSLRIGHIINSDCSFKSEVRIQEEKTDKLRTCYMNTTVMDAAELYLSTITGELNLNDYLFKSFSNNNSEAYYEALTSIGRSPRRGVDSCLSTKSVERMLKSVINDELGIDVHASTHLLRKTFAYHVIMNAPDRSRAIEFLQKIFGHSSQAITLHYAGITKEEVMTVCQNLTLGAEGMDMGKEFCYAAGLDVSARALSNAI